MPRSAILKRRSFLVDEEALRRARRVLGVTTDAEAVRTSVERIVEMEAFRKFMHRTRGTLEPGSLKTPVTVSGRRRSRRMRSRGNP
jgi:hypothetical protein